jgi:hypothetical protein
VDGPCEHSNEPSGSIKCWEILEWLLHGVSYLIMSYFVGGATRRYLRVLSWIFAEFEWYCRILMVL